MADSSVGAYCFGVEVAKPRRRRKARLLMAGTSKKPELEATCTMRLFARLSDKMIRWIIEFDTVSSKRLAEQVNQSEVLTEPRHQEKPTQATIHRAMTP